MIVGWRIIWQMSTEWKLSKKVAYWRTWTENPTVFTKKLVKEWIVNSLPSFFQILQYVPFIVGVKFIIIHTTVDGRNKFYLEKETNKKMVQSLGIWTWFIFFQNISVFHYSSLFLYLSFLKNIYQFVIFLWISRRENVAKQKTDNNCTFYISFV